MIGGAHRFGEDHGPHSSHRGVPRFDHALVCFAPHYQRVVPCKHLSEIDVRILHDPVVFTVWSCDIPIQAHHHAVADFPHRSHLTSPLCGPAEPLAYFTSKPRREQAAVLEPVLRVSDGRLQKIRPSGKWSCRPTGPNLPHPRFWPPGSGFVII